MNINDKERLVLDTDARSRIAIDFTNNVDSRRIAQYGDLTHDTIRGGFIFPDGKTAVSADARYVQFLHGSGYPIQTPMPLSPVPMPISAIPQVIPFSPYDVTKLLLNLDPQYDFIRTCKMLKLNKMDFDTINTGIIIRSIPDDKKMILLNCIPIPTFDHLGSFDRMYALFDCALFELKTFKFWDRPNPYQFLFRPEHSGLWFRDGIPAQGGIIIDTDILAVYSRTSPANVGLIYAGGIASIDWELLRGRDVLYVWQPGEFQSSNRLAVALHFLAEAKKHDVCASLLMPHRQIADVPAAIVQARRYGLDIPSVLKETGYVQPLAPQEKFIPHDIPTFWAKGSATLFFGPGYRTILEKLLKAFTGTPDTATGGDAHEQDGTGLFVFPKKQVGIYYPASTGTRIKRLVGKIELSIPCISSAISLDALETALFQNSIQIMIIPYAEKIPSQVLADVLDLCERIGVVVGIFSLAEGRNGSIPEDVLSGTTKELVAQYYLISTDGDAVIARDVTTGTVKRFNFEDDGSVSIADINNTSNTNKKEI